jgi:hypothetical protein
LGAETQLLHPEILLSGSWKPTTELTIADIDVFLLEDLFTSPETNMEELFNQFICIPGE